MSNGISGTTKKTVELIISKESDELERFAASELQGYLRRLFGVSASIANSPGKTAEYFFILGNPHKNLAQALGKENFPQLSNQGFLLRKITLTGKPAIVVAGGSPVATMWGVYELVERYGVRYLLHGDIYPEKKGDFHLPEIDKVFEPVFRVRWWRTMGDFAMGTEGWGMADYRPLLDQLAKLKFNRIRVGSSPSQPFLHLEIKGVKQQSATLWYGYRYPITEDMPGRELFSDEKEFWNPDLPLPGASYEELIAAGERHCHELIAYAHSRGMESNFIGAVTDFPKDFRPIIPDAQTVYQLGNLTVGPGPAVMPDNQDLLEIAGEVIKTTINTYPEADSYGFGVSPEASSWTERYKWAWQKLDEKYQIGQIISLEETLEKASNRTGYAQGAERALTDLKGHITGLYFMDRLLSSPEVLPKSLKPDTRIAIYEVAEELFPILSRVMPKGSELVVVMDYTPTRVLRRRDVLRNVSAKEIPAILILTIQDDNIGVLPQLTTGSLYELVCDLRKYGWSGFCTRQWMISDHDPCVSYLSKAAWNANVTPEEVYIDQIRAVCGEAAIKPMLEAFRELEAVTVALEEHGVGLTFPVPGMMMKHWAPGPFSSQLAEDREGYRRALSAVRKVPQPSRPEGKTYVDYWIGRLEFGIGYFDTIESVRKAATAEQAAKEAKEKGDERSFRAYLSETVEQAQVAQKKARQCIEAFANVAKNQSDRGTIATMAEYVYRPLKQKVEKLRAETL